MEEKICLRPMGKVDADVLEWIARGIEREFSLPAQGLDAVEVPMRAFSEKRQQYYSTAFLQELMRTIHDDAFRILGITDVDLFVPQLNFVFGEAAVEGRAGVISLYRLRPEFYGEIPDEELFAERAVKEAVHELGHTFGLRHCSTPGCVMRFSTRIEDTDRKSVRFCADDALNLAQKLHLPDAVVASV